MWQLGAFLLFRCAVFSGCAFPRGKGKVEAADCRSSKEILALATHPEILRATTTPLGHMFSTLMSTRGPLRCRLFSAGVVDSQVLLFPRAHPRTTP